MGKRPQEDHVYDALCRATRELILSAGGLERAAQKTRVSKSTLASYYDPQASVFMPIDVVADLESTVNDMPVSRELARLKKVFICEVPDASRDDMIEFLADVADRVGSVFRESSIALAKESDLNAEEVASLRDAVYECFQSLLTLESSIRTVGSGSGDEAA